jgi:hypothetical protein
VIKIRNKQLRWFAGVVLPAVLFMLFAFAANADARDADEILKIKAAFVYNFAKYVQWPDECFEDGSSSIVIGITAMDEVYETLEATVKDKHIGDRPIEVIALNVPRYQPDEHEDYRLELEDFANRMAGCHLVYFGQKERPWVADLHKQAKLPPHTLTVGDGGDYLKVPTMLDLVKEDGRIVFYADHDRIEQSSMKVSSKLLKLARNTE